MSFPILGKIRSVFSNPWKILLVLLWIGYLAQAGGCKVTDKIGPLAERHSFTVMAANLTDDRMGYTATSERIFKGLQPDIVAIQEWLITQTNHRAYVDAVFGTNFSFAVETFGGNDIPNGVISRWPITASGEWPDSHVTGRDFVWATVDLPGTQDLHVISVHLKSGDAFEDEATRAQEAWAILAYIRDANWPATDFIVIAGDFNNVNRNDNSLQALSAMFSDSRKPADQDGDDDTNATRRYPYDYVLPSHLLNARHVALTVGGIVFPEGLVFDSRVWQNPPAPIRRTDSVGYAMQHMAVMKRFAY